MIREPARWLPERTSCDGTGASTLSSCSSPRMRRRYLPSSAESPEPRPALSLPHYLKPFGEVPLSAEAREGGLLAESRLDR